MTFREKYEDLERRFEKKCYHEHTGFPTLFAPDVPVDFVLIAMEPSLGGGKPGEHQCMICAPQDMKSSHSTDSPYNECRSESSSSSCKNFSYSVEDFILHFCINKYLCENNETYYLTDLSKGGMSVGEAKEHPTKRYERWFPLPLEELELVAKRDALVIAIGQQAHRFLVEKKRKLPRKLAGSILHYSQQAGGARKKVPHAQKESYREFSPTVSFEDIEDTVRWVMKWGEIDSHIEPTLKRIRRGSCLTDSRKKLMFTYKVQYNEIREKAG